MKHTLNEAQLNAIIEESVNETLNEWGGWGFMKTAAGAEKRQERLQNRLNKVNQRNADKGKAFSNRSLRLQGKLAAHQARIGAVAGQAFPYNEGDAPDFADDSNMVMKFQSWVNANSQQGNVLAVDGVWAPKSQGAFDEWIKVMKQQIGQQGQINEAKAPLDLTDHIILADYLSKLAGQNKTVAGGSKQFIENISKLVRSGKLTTNGAIAQLEKKGLSKLLPAAFSNPYTAAAVIAAAVVGGTMLFLNHRNKKGLAALQKGKWDGKYPWENQQIVSNQNKGQTGNKQSNAPHMNGIQGQATVQNPTQPKIAPTRPSTSPLPQLDTTKPSITRESVNGNGQKAVDRAVKTDAQNQRIKQNALKESYNEKLYKQFINEIDNAENKYKVQESYDKAVNYKRMGLLKEGQFNDIESKYLNKTK